MANKPTYEELEKTVNKLRREVEKLRDAEEVSRESEEHLTSLMESATNFAVYRLINDSDNSDSLRVIFVSPSITDIMGVPEPMSFKAWFEHIHPDDEERIVRANIEAFKTNRFDETMRIYHPQKQKWIWIHAVSTGFEDQERQCRYVNGILVDVTREKESEKELKESGKKLNAVLDATTETVLLLDKEGIVHAANQIIRERLGTTKEEIIGKRLYDFFPPDVAETRRKKYNEVFNTGKPVRFEDSRAGMIFEQSVYPILDDGDQLIMVAVFANDMTKRKKAEKELEKAYDVVGKKVKERTAELLKTNQQLKKEIEERKQAEEGLRDSEQRLAQTINFLPDATMVIDLEGKVIAWNQAIENMTGIKAQDMLGKGNYEYAIPFYGERRPVLIDIVGKWEKEIEKKYQYIKEEGESLVSETYDPIIKPGGFLWNKASLLYDHNGEMIGAIESIRDITGRKVAEDAVRESEEKYRELAENAGLGIFQVTKAGKFLMANQRMAEIFGYDSQQDFLGNVGNAVKLYVNPEERPGILKDIDEKGHVGRELNLKRKDGTPIFCNTHIRSIRSENGEYTL